MPQMIVAGRIEGGPHSPAIEYYADLLRCLLPLMERVGVATAAEVEIDRVAERLRKEAVASNASILLPPLAGAWAHMPE